jgi:hypothetical protein
LPGATKKRTVKNRGEGEEMAVFGITLIVLLIVGGEKARL